jgi:hypothetical protein
MEALVYGQMKRTTLLANIGSYKREAHQEKVQLAVVTCQNFIVCKDLALHS